MSHLTWHMKGPEQQAVCVWGPTLGSPPRLPTHRHPTPDWGDWEPAASVGEEGEPPDHLAQHQPESPCVGWEQSQLGLERPLAPVGGVVTPFLGETAPPGDSEISLSLFGPPPAAQNLGKWPSSDLPR